MKKVFTILTAVSALAAAVSANAALINFDVSSTQYQADFTTQVVGLTVGGVDGGWETHGNGVLNTSTGVFDFAVHGHWIDKFHLGPGEANHINQYPSELNFDWIASVHTGPNPSGTYTTFNCLVTTGAGWYNAPICASNVLLNGVTNSLQGPAGYPFFGAAGAGDWNVIDPLVFNTTPGAHTIFAGLNVNSNRIELWDVTPSAARVPVPAAAWLFGSGLIGVMAKAKKRRV